MQISKQCGHVSDVKGLMYSSQIMKSGALKSWLSSMLL